MNDRDDARLRERSATMDSDDALVREPLPSATRPPLPPRKLAALAALAVLLVVTLVGTSALVIRDLNQQGTRTTRSAVLLPAGTPTVDLSDPKNNGWTEVGGGTFVAVQFAPSNLTRGYLCGLSDAKARTLGVTTDGGTTWQFSPSPAGYDYCWIQVSPTNPLDVVLNSSVGPCGGNCPGLDAHYSMDGGRTWTAAPIPPDTGSPGGALWAGSYLYAWNGPVPVPNTTQPGFLKVSANGGPFRDIALNALVPGAKSLYFGTVLSGGSKLYLGLTYNGSGTHCCEAVASSADGGATWTVHSNTSDFELAGVAGNTLYATMPDPKDPSSHDLATSNDTGATWKPLPLPPLSNGQSAVVDVDGAWLPAPDGTIFVVDPQYQSVAYLHGGSWTEIPFSPAGESAYLAAVSLGADGQRRVWIDGVFAGGGKTLSGLYWHAVP